MNALHRESAERDGKHSRKFLEVMLGPTLAVERSFCEHECAARGDVSG